MEKIVRCNVGIDVAKDDFKTVILAVTDNNQTTDLGHQTFANSNKGFKNLISWCQKTVTDCKPTFTMEFTGCYSMGLCEFIYNAGYQVFMVSPYKSKRFRESYDADIKTDDRDALTLAQMGCERKLTAWQSDSEFYQHLKMLVRERLGLVKQQTAIINKLHALDYQAKKAKSTIKRYNEQLKLIRKQLKEIDKEIDGHLKSDEQVSRKVENMETIPGIGITTIATVLAETDGFRKTPNSRQLVAFAGYKVTVSDSGTISKPGHISKRGNKFIRQALHMPTLSIIQCNPVLKEKYQSLKLRKVKPIIATTAIERKALILMYSIFKSDTRFDPNFLKKQNTMN